MVERASRRADRLVGEHADKTPALAFWRARMAWSPPCRAHMRWFRFR